MILQIAHVFYVLSLSLWLGGMLFFSAITTPIAFKSLPKEMASAFITAIFPTYYYYGFGLLVVLLLSFVLKVIVIKKLLILPAILIVIAIASSLYAGVVLLPKIHQLKIELATIEDQESAEAQAKQKTFRSLHGVSVALNLLCMLLAVILLVQVSVQNISNKFSS